MPVLSNYATVVPLAGRNSPGNSGEFFVGPAQLFVVEIKITAKSGTGNPALNIDIEDTFNGTDWNQIGVNAAGLSQIGRTVRRFNLIATPCTEAMRFVWTMTGNNPSFTFSIAVFAARP